MTEINFLIRKEIFNEMTWDEIEVFELAEEGELKISKVKSIIARFMVDENNQPIEHTKALKMLGRLKVEQIRDTIQKFMEVVRTSTVPKANGTQSQQPLEQVSEVSPSLTG